MCNTPAQTEHPFSLSSLEKQLEKVNSEGLYLHVTQLGSLWWSVSLYRESGQASHGAGGGKGKTLSEALAAAYSDSKARQLVRSYDPIRPARKEKVSLSEL